LKNLFGNNPSANNQARLNHVYTTPNTKTSSSSSSVKNEQQLPPAKKQRTGQTAAEAASNIPVSAQASGIEVNASGDYANEYTLVQHMQQSRQNEIQQRMANFAHVLSGTINNTPMLSIGAENSRIYDKTSSSRNMNIQQ